MELKQTEAAIEAYRQAVDINPHDYRAWYGLGQTYEMHRMYFYALHYYRKACVLRPYDARMWLALGGCYESLESGEGAVKCLERAIANGDVEGVGRIKLARLRRKRGEAESAAKLYEGWLRRHCSGDDGDEVDVSTESAELVGEPPAEETVEALTFLAGHYRNAGELERAERACLRLIGLVGAGDPRGRGEAMAILREVRSLKRGGAMEKK